MRWREEAEEWSAGFSPVDNAICANIEGEQWKAGNIA